MQTNTPQKSAISLTRELLAFNTINPPGNEEECAKFVGKILEDSGFQVEYYEFDKGRTNLIASINLDKNKPPICFTGHLDVVPLGVLDWQKGPFSGEIDDGKIYGRGSSDMKSGIAAFVIAASKLISLKNSNAGIYIVITAGEETGCIGAKYLSKLPGVLRNVGAMVVAEPTSNYPLIGHKGALWLEAIARGVTAHGAMPQQGVNAIYKAAKAISLLQDFRFGAAHPVLGNPTLNVGTISGGINVNSVPDYARFEIDIRTIPDQEHKILVDQLVDYLGSDIELKIIQSEDAIATDPNNKWILDVFDIVNKISGENFVAKAAPYFTDASVLSGAMASPPTIILGPGEISMAHKTDEFCLISKIEESVEANFEIGRNWIQGSS